MSTPIPIGREAAEVAQGRGKAGGPARARVCVVGASGKLGRYIVQHALNRGYEVIAVCREVSVDKLEEFSGRITIIPGMTDDREVIGRAVAGCDGVLTVLVPRGVQHYSSRTAQVVLDQARPRRSPGVLVRLPHHPRGPGRVLVEGQDARTCGGPARASLRSRRPRRPGGGVPAGLRQ
jgi:hypothetical protein